MSQDKWESYKPGDKELKKHNMLVLSIAADSPYKKNMFYELQFLCCGLVSTVSHQRIEKRLKAGQKLCRYCGRHNKSRRDLAMRLEIPLPLWPVPGSSESTAQNPL